jgi:hypothetical protein
LFLDPEREVVLKPSMSAQAVLHCVSAMALRTVTFTMRNEGFRSQYVAPYCKAILVMAVLDDAKCIVAMVVLGIPLPAIKTLERQHVLHYERNQVPKMLLLAIEEYCDRRVAEAFDRVGANLFRTLEKPARIQ